MTTLRPYQQAFITNLRQCLAQSQRVIACMATGAGKTKCFLSITATALQRGTTVLILTESSKIFRQIATEQPSAKHISAKQKYVYIEPGGLYIAMAQTLQRRPQIIAQLHALSTRLLIINDEAHVGTATPVLEQLPDAYILAFTASPDYRFGKHLPKLYRGIVVGPQPQELVEAGYLAPYYHYEKKAADLSALKKGKDGDFTEQSNEWAFDRPTVYKGFEEDLARIAPKKAIVFCSSIKHADHVAAGLRATGRMVAVVHTANPEASYELASFMHGNTGICVTVAQLVKGWDFPGITDVFLLRAINSLPLYLQCCGRGSRTAPGKQKWTVWDYGENATRLGLWSEDRDWATMWLPKKGKRKDGVAPAKECPRCYLMNPSTARVCRECGYEFPRTEQEEQEGILQDALASYNNLRGRWISTLTPQELATYARTTNKRPYAMRVARGRGRQYLLAFGQEMGYKSGWADQQERMPGYSSDGSAPGFADVLIR